MSSEPHPSQLGRISWEFGTRQVVYSAIGAALYGVLNWVFNSLALPGSTLVSFRPSVAVPFFMGIVFGPWVGLFTGGVGNVLGDALSGFGFFWGWDVGNGLLGFIPGLLISNAGTAGASGPRVFSIVLTVAVASCIGLAFPALIVDPFILRNIDIRGGFATEWLPATISDTLNGAILTPGLLSSWNAYQRRTGR